ncbi:BrxA/BrxB family bacilliredoxin [Putridiphycobacter roseus]|uniref:BrxA/BrxB family bacilliredoxin n=1 Tax=Putridiphycobacter roseus TaxID=2219161 RepID=A0A2W1NBH9_9FLAO|nr:BrxA/BrxB family bacilliredoxin [Putridiphycobacter roseus]PZE16675.1 BrxA/BrxB family bacilliredoxin [Putridiphycobacter roseus]
MYPEELTTPMKAELTSAGFESLETPEAVDNKLNSKEEETVLVVINSVCGCAAGSLRPGVLQAIKHNKIPSKLTTVFAGVDPGAVNQARKYTLPYPPSSPSVGLFKNGTLVHFLERHHIEGRSAEMIAENLTMAFDEYC